MMFVTVAWRRNGHIGNWLLSIQLHTGVTETLFLRKPVNYGNYSGFVVTSLIFVYRLSTSRSLTTISAAGPDAPSKSMNQKHLPELSNSISLWHEP
jgi:hypothetical protein